MPRCVPRAGTACGSYREVEETNQEEGVMGNMSGEIGSESRVWGRARWSEREKAGLGGMSRKDLLENGVIQAVIDTLL